jgi:hypothetical protein
MVLVFTAIGSLWSKRSVNPSYSNSSIRLVWKTRAFSALISLAQICAGLSDLPYHETKSGSDLMHVHVSLELTGIALATIAALALWFAWRQVREMQESTRRQADSARNVELQTRANVLLTLDERWETEPMLSVRRELGILISVVEAELARADPQSRDVLRLRTAPALAARLDQLRREDFEQILSAF